MTKLFTIGGKFQTIDGKFAIYDQQALEDCCCGAPKRLFMIYIDESSDVYYPSGGARWDADVAVWEDGRYASGNWRAGVCDTKTYWGADLIKPISRSIPSSIGSASHWNIPIFNDPVNGGVKQHFEAWRGGWDPTDISHVYFIIDSSGSMSGHELDQAIDSFTIWVGNEWPNISVYKSMASDERWVRWIG